MPMALLSSIICWPLVRPESTEGEMRSPPKVVMLFAVRRRSTSRSDMNGAKPPPLPGFGPIS